MSRPPPYSRLAVPSALARLSAGELAEDTDLIEMTRTGYTQAANLRRQWARETWLVRLQRKPYGRSFSGQVRSSLFELATVTEMETMFGATIDTVNDEEEADHVPIQKGEILECCFLAMAMGWSWAPLSVATMPSRRPCRQRSDSVSFLKSWWVTRSLWLFCPGTVRGQCKPHRAHPRVR